jgi:hypothetical protein
VFSGIETYRGKNLRYSGDTKPETNSVQITFLLPLPFIKSLAAFLLVQTWCPVNAAIGFDRLYATGVFIPLFCEKDTGTVYLAYREMLVIVRPVPGVALLPVINGNTQIGIDTPNLFGADKGGVLTTAVTTT